MPNALVYVIYKHSRKVNFIIVSACKIFARKAKIAARKIVKQKSLEKNMHKKLAAISQKNLINKLHKKTKSLKIETHY